MCTNMQDFKSITEKLYELEKKKAKKKQEMDNIEKEIKQLKAETSCYMKKRQKNSLTVAGLEVLFTVYSRSTFDKDAFIHSQGEDIYKKYLRETPMERITIRLCKA